MATLASTRDLLDVAYYVEPAFECSYFDVAYNDPSDGANLYLARIPKRWQERNFEDRVIGEIIYFNQEYRRRMSHCMIYSTKRLEFCNLRKGRLFFLGKVGKAEEFGPFFSYKYELGV